MAWEWSHTTDAYINARDNLLELEGAVLCVVYAEWKANQHGEDSFNRTAYDRALRKTEGMSNDALADYIWERAEEQALCTNGGHRVWICPFGCHTVSFDDEAEELEGDNIREEDRL